MIHLDTNYLIALAQPGSQAGTNVKLWLAQEESFTTSALAWMEFLNGPITGSDVLRARALIESRVLPFTEEEAVMAARLFNATGRRRGFTTDCGIASTAILAGAPLATFNVSDFIRFKDEGLILASPPGSK